MGFKRSFLLCAKCLSRNKGNTRADAAKSGSECAICKGAFLRIPRLAEEAKGKAEEHEFSTFSVSSAVPRSFLVAEDSLWDTAGLENCASLKDALNSELASALSKKLRKKFKGKNSDGNFQFDFAGSSVSFSPAPLYIFGRYLKLSREIGQSRWPCSRCAGKGCRRCAGKGRMYDSVEEAIASHILPICGGKSTKLHAAGREDIDARMVGEGRPFVLEIASPKKRKLELAKIENEINKREDAGVNGLRTVSKNFVELVSNSRFEKEYFAIVSADRKLDENDAGKVLALAGKTLMQRTPLRVAHRRSDLVRKKRIKSISAKAVAGKIELKVLAEAGTYIKELISGDEGRTKPSVSEMLGCKAQCELLDVIGIRDKFIETVQE